MYPIKAAPILNVDSLPIPKAITNLHHHLLDPFYRVTVLVLIPWLHQHAFDCLDQNHILILLQAKIPQHPRIEDHPLIPLILLPPPHHHLHVHLIKKATIIIVDISSIEKQHLMLYPITKHFHHLT